MPGPSSSPRRSGSRSWYLEGCADEKDALHRFPVTVAVHLVGRHPSADLRLRFPNVSAKHAELVWEDGRLQVRDLGSRNGTFVNRERLESATRSLDDGDLVHFATHEFRVGCSIPTDDPVAQTVGESLRATSLPDGIQSSLLRFRQLLMRRSVRPVFQPVVDLASGAVLGYEILGRGNEPGLPANPMELFRLAHILEAECELSEVFRAAGILLGAELPDAPQLFVNTHPAELADRWLEDSLKRMRTLHPELPIVVELHEACVTSPDQTRALRAVLTDLDIGLAYDDFGAGRSRLLELVEVPPDFLKFDISLIRDLDRASSTKQKMIETLVSMVGDQGIRCIAEGIETEAEQETCVALGLELGQGYHLGRPASIQHWLPTDLG